MYTSSISEDSALSDFIRSVDAYLTYFLHISNPESLSDEIWMEKYRQVQWLSEQGLLGFKG